MTTRILLSSERSDPSFNGTTDLFHRCWRLQTCDLCISSKDACAWCAVSQTCVPNVDHATIFSILAPIRSESICPLGWQERWELRTKAFGCRCSTMTVMSVMVAVISTLCGILLLWAIAKGGKRMVRIWKGRGEDWWRLDRIKHQQPNSLRWPWLGALWQQQKPNETENTDRQPLLD
jgi:hypothetical protein